MQLSLSGLIDTVDPSNPEGITTVNLLPDKEAEALLPEVILMFDPVKLYEPKDAVGIAEQSTPKFPEASWFSPIANWLELQLELLARVGPNNPATASVVLVLALPSPQPDSSSCPE